MRTLSFQKLLVSLAMLLSFQVLAAPFDGLIFDQETKDNLKKMNGLNKKKGFTILWWNVAWGHFNGDGSIDKNLLTLMNSTTSPDVLAFGEFKPVVLQEATKTALNEVYKYYAFVPYEKGDEVGIAIYSKTEFMQSESHDLDWTPMKATVNEAEAYRKDWKDFDLNWVRHWRRSVTLFHVEKPDGKIVNIVPTHLASPWVTIQKRLGNWKTFRTIMGANENPLLNQQERLTDFLTNEFGKDMNSARMILLGDFNIPSKVRIPLLGGTPKMYKLLKGPLSSVLDSSDDTFPTKSSLSEQPDFFKKHALQLDHVFHNKKVTGVRAEVIHLKGSDHYPLLIITD